MANPVRFDEITKLIGGRQLSHIPKFRKITVAGIDEFMEDDQREEPLLPKVIEVVEAYFTDEPKSMFLSGCVGCRKTGTMQIIETYLWYGLYLWEQRLDKPVNTPNPSRGTNDMHYVGADVELQYHQMLAKRKDIKRIKHKPLSDQLKKKQIEGYVPDSVLSAHTLFIEDLGTDQEDKTGFALSLEQLFFDDRSEMLCPNFVTSNLSSSELRSWPGWSRIIDRLLDKTCTITYNYGDNAKSRRS